MTKTATVEAPVAAAPEVVPTLDETIANLLNTPEGSHSAVLFSVAIFRVRSAIESTEREAREAAARAVDPTVLDGGAAGLAHDLEFKVRRYKNALDQLTAREQAAEKRERREAHESEIAPLEERVTALAAEVTAQYSELAGKIAQLLLSVVAVNQEVQLTNARAYDLRQLRTVEQVIGTSLKIGDPQQIKLPALVSNGVVAPPDIWPPKVRDIGLQYFDMVHAAILNTPPPPTEQEKIEAMNRHMRIVEEQEAGRLRNNAEAAARAKQAAAVARRLAAGY
jgi:hypothetical protein